MNQLRASTWLAAFALATSCACAAAWVAGWSVGGSLLWSRAAILAATLGISAGIAAMLVRRWTRAAAEAHRALADLAQHDRPGSVGAHSATNRTLTADNPWSETVGKIGASLTASWTRALDAEHQRAALEIRARRSMEQCQQVTTILNGLADPVLVLDEYNNLMMANASAERMFHLDGVAAGQQALAQVVHCERLLELLTDTRRRAAASRTEELELPDAAGVNRWYGLTTTNLSAEGSPQPHAMRVAVLRDISGKIAIQRRHAEFISAVSHEMKTPLAGIKAYVELLVDGDAEDDATREEFLQVINGQADRLQRLIDNLLNLSRIESGVVKVDKRPRPLNELLEEAASVIRPAAEEKNIDLAVELSSLYLGALIDRDQMLQAAINLLSNAIKYTPQGGRVTLRSRLRDQQVQFEVEDTGVGLSEEDQQRVFDRFYRVQKDQQMAPGTGLGLPLAKYIVEDVHGGRLTIRSLLGAGSTFLVSLPAAGQVPNKMAEVAK